MKKLAPFIPDQGERMLIVGQTGMGKTALVTWILQRIPVAPIFIYDTKIEPKFTKLPASKVAVTVEDAQALVDDETVDYIVVRPPDEILGEPKLLDDYLWYHYQNFHGCPAYIDEGVTFMRGDRALRGMLSLMQRGRSKGITTIVSSQRPKRIDRSIITEASKVVSLRLGDKDDRKRLSDVIPNFHELPLPQKHWFYYFESGEEKPDLYKPVEIDDNLNTGYVDTSEPGQSAQGDEAQGDEPEKPGEPPKAPNLKHVWI